MLDRPYRSSIRYFESKSGEFTNFEGTPDQVAGSVRHDLFGKDMSPVTAFDLHIVLANFNAGGEKGKLVGPTQRLASTFKARLQSDHPMTAACLGHVLCISAQREEEIQEVTELKCDWMV